jgi:hypothetical protein
MHVYVGMLDMCRYVHVYVFEGRKGATDTKEDPGRPRGVVTRICTAAGRRDRSVTGPGPAKTVLKS